MSNRHRRPTTKAAEHLLSDGRGPASGDPLHALLNAAAAPAQPHELADTAATLDRLRTARLQPPRDITRPVRSPLTLVVKLAALVLALLGGGWALAATTGVLPARLLPTESHRSTAAARHDPGSPSATTSRPGVSPAVSPTAASTATPAPQWPGLCRALLAHSPKNQGKLLDTPAFADLVTAAHGKAQAPAYCAALLGVTPTPSTSAPSPPDKKKDKTKDGKETGKHAKKRAPVASGARERDDG